MESQRQVSKTNQMKLFFVTLGTMLVAIVAPIAIWQAFYSSAALGAVVSTLFGGGIVLGVRRVILLSRAPGAKLFERSSHALLTICLTGGLLFTVTGSFVATIHQHAHT